MTTLELLDFPVERSLVTGLLGALGRLFALVKNWYHRRQTVFLLSRLSAHLLSDVGLEPCAVHDALEGRGSALWQKVNPRSQVH